MLYTITIIFLYMTVGYISSVQLLSQVQLLAIPWTTAHQAPLSITNSRTLLKLKSIESVMPSNHLILCGPLLLLPSIFPSIRAFSKDWALCKEAKVLELQFQYQSFQWTFRTDFLQDWLVWSLCSPRDSQELSPTPQLKRINSSSLLSGLALTSIHDYWKNHSFDSTDLYWQSDVSAFQYAI